MNLSEYIGDHHALHYDASNRQLFDELTESNMICTFAMLYSDRNNSAVASRALYYAIKQNGV